jgi:hypothetical protein
MSEREITAGRNGGRESALRRWALKVKLPCDGANGCWEWMGATVGKRGTRRSYGQISVNRRTVLAHRYSYERFVGPIPAGLQLDHLCRNPACVNPAHLEAVTQRTNILRGESPCARNASMTHCPCGLALKGKNLYVAPDGSRRCVECRKQLARRRHAERTREDPSYRAAKARRRREVLARKRHRRTDLDVVERVRKGVARGE